MKIKTRAIPLFLALVVGIALSAASARAQSNVSAYFGMGTAWDTAAPGCVYILSDLGYSEPAGPCANGGYPTPSMGGLFGVFGADFMFKSHLGVGGEYNFRFAQSPYGDVNYRPVAYDFNAIYHPISSGRVIPEIQGGIGGFSTEFYLPSSCLNIGCSGTSYISSSTHFQIHGAVGLKLYVKGGLFVKPQFDIHFVPHLSGPINPDGTPSEQFGSDWVPEATVSVGYTFGQR